MAEFVDVHFVYVPGSYPEMWFADDHGNVIAAPFMEVAVHDDAYTADGGEHRVIRIQHGDIDKL